jgi:Ni/Co efflux regulator RcnB
MLRELLTMKNILFAGIAATSMLMISPAIAASDSSVSKAETGKSTSIGGIFDGRRDGGHGTMPHVGPRPGGHGPGIGGPGMGGNHRWGHRIGGRWFAGFHAPGGWNGYRAPFRGFTLPTYWVQPSYRIVNFPTYGLYAPQTGYGWSRYYDDAVLTDSRGYVQDHRSNIPWDRYEGGYAPGEYSEADYGPAMGADRGVYSGDDRVYSGSGYPPPPPQQQVEYRQGTGQQEYRQNDYDPRYDTGGNPSGQGYRSRNGFEEYERCLSNRGVTGALLGTVVGGVIGNRVSGRDDRLAGTLAGAGVGALLGRSIEKAAKKCKKYLPRDDQYYYSQGGYQGGGYQNGGYQGGYQPQPQYAPPPPPQPQGNPYGYQGGYYQNGWYYPAPTVTTITVSPAVTTTTTTTEEYYYETVSVPAKKKAVRKWKPKPKPRCGC